MIRLKDITVVLIICVSLFFSDFAYAKKHRLLMDMAEIGVERYVMKHEMKKLGLKAENRILMNSGERISLDELKTRLLAQRNALAQLSEKEKMINDGAKLWKNTRLGTKGQWSGVKGESYYSLPTDSKYMAKTEQKGVYHGNGHPFLHDKDTARLTMDKPSGNSLIDIKKAYERMGNIINKSRKYISDVFSKEKRTLHHTPDGKSLISVDSYVHSKTPHSGGSSYNRNTKGVMP